jgi:hypothetical protein
MAGQMPAALRKMPKHMQDLVRAQCGGDWGRVTVEDGGFVVHNKSHSPAPVRNRTPVSEKPPQLRVVKLPPALPERQAKAPGPSGRGLRSRGEALAALEAELVALPKVESVEVPEESGFTPGRYRGMPVAQMAQDLVANGFLGAMKYHPDVLAMEGLPWEDVEAAIRGPHRVDLRPETAKKGYPVFQLSRGDVRVIIGFQHRDSPAVIAVYWTHLLGHDGHYVNHMGGSGGARSKTTGTPKTPKQVVRRLEELGVSITPKDGTKLGVCTYKGQELGTITIEMPCDRKTCDSDWNRIQRRVNAIFRRQHKGT